MSSGIGGICETVRLVVLTAAERESIINIDSLILGGILRPIPFRTEGHGVANCPVFRTEETSLLLSPLDLLELSAST